MPVADYWAWLLWKYLCREYLEVRLFLISWLTSSFSTSSSTSKRWAASFSGLNTLLKAQRVKHWLFTEISLSLVWLILKLQSVLANQKTHFNITVNSGRTILTSHNATKTCVIIELLRSFNLKKQRFPDYFWLTFFLLIWQVPACSGLLPRYTGSRSGPDPVYSFCSTMF